MRWYRMAGFMDPIPPKGDVAHGTMGYSRIFDMACMYLEMMGMRRVDKQPHLAAYAMAEDSPHDEHVVLSWGPASYEGPAIGVAIRDCDAGCEWRPMVPGDYLLRTDRSHSWPPTDFHTIVYTAFHEAETRHRKRTHG